MNILLGVTGSVAATLTPKMIAALNEIGNVRVLTTKWGEYFFNSDDVDVPLLRDDDEWYRDGRHKVWNKKGDPVVHIDLRKWAGMLVIAPLTANTLGKFANGICDNLLTSVLTAWDWTRPVVVAPAMNSMMWENPITLRNMKVLNNMGVTVVDPQTKMLVCNETGVGAMANIKDIAAAVNKRLRWSWPFCFGASWSGVPIAGHPGSFGVRRKYSHHTGVDLYTTDGAAVLAMEDGRVVCREQFTGPQDNSPWWLNTDALLVEGASGVICYGEIAVDSKMESGTRVYRGDVIGRVKYVLPEGRERPDIPGHSRAMLHVELYERDRLGCSTSWKLSDPKHDYLLDPTSKLIEAMPEQRVLTNIVQSIQRNSGGLA